LLLGHRHSTTWHWHLLLGLAHVVIGLLRLGAFDDILGGAGLSLVLLLGLEGVTLRHVGVGGSAHLLLGLENLTLVP